MNKGFLLSAFILCLGCILCSCGYTLRSGMEQDIHSISVAVFDNETYEHGLGTDLTGFLSREFIDDGTLSVAGADTADVRISGAVREYILEPYAYGATEADVEQYRLRVRALAALKTLPGEASLWKEYIEGETVYHVAGRLGRTEEQARTDALRDLARKIVRRTVGGW